MFDLSGKAAVVTGAGQNVGAGIARALAAQGATVHVNDIVPERAAETVAQITAAGGAASVAPFDVTDYDEVTAAIEDVGTVDILVNNAGNGGAEGMGLVQFRESEPAGWKGAINVNLFGVLHCSRAVINGMCERGFGRVITISSGAGITGLRIGVSPYAAGKGGAISFMRHLAIGDGALRRDRELARARADAAGQLRRHRRARQADPRAAAPVRPKTSAPRASTSRRTRRRG